MPGRRRLAMALLIGLVLTACSSDHDAPVATATVPPVPAAPGAALGITGFRDAEVSLSSGTFKHLEPTGRLEAVFRSEAGTKLVVRGPGPDDDPSAYSVAIELGPDIVDDGFENRRFIANDGECQVTVDEGADLTGELTCQRVTGSVGIVLTTVAAAFRAEPVTG